jgi:hypothetical protein
MSTTPDNGDLAGWKRGESGLEEIADMNGVVSPRLGIRFEPGEGPNDLKIFAPDGRPFLTYVDLFEDRETERKRAERLATRLRELGVNPD